MVWGEQDGLVDRGAKATFASDAVPAWITKDGQQAARSFQRPGTGQCERWSVDERAHRGRGPAAGRRGRRRSRRPFSGFCKLLVPGGRRVTGRRRVAREVGRPGRGRRAGQAGQVGRRRADTVSSQPREEHRGKDQIEAGQPAWDEREGDDEDG